MISRQGGSRWGHLLPHLLLGMVFAQDFQDILQPGEMFHHWHDEFPTSPSEICHRGKLDEQPYQQLNLPQRDRRPTSLYGHPLNAVGHNSVQSRHHSEDLIDSNTVGIQAPTHPHDLGCSYAQCFQVFSCTRTHRILISQDNNKAKTEQEKAALNPRNPWFPILLTGILKLCHIPG